MGNKHTCSNCRLPVGRYLLCEVNVTNRDSLLQLRESCIAQAVRGAVERTHGDYGAAHCIIGFHGNFNLEIKYLFSLVKANASLQRGVARSPYLLLTWPSPYVPSYVRRVRERRG